MGDGVQIPTFWSGRTDPHFISTPSQKCCLAPHISGQSYATGKTSPHNARSESKCVIYWSGGACQWRRSRWVTRVCSWPPMLEMGIKAVSLTPNNQWQNRSTFSYLKRTKMQNFDHKFSKHFREATAEAPSSTLPHPSPCFLTPNIFDAPPPLVGVFSNKKYVLWNMVSAP